MSLNTEISKQIFSAMDDTSDENVKKLAEVCHKLLVRVTGLQEKAYGRDYLR